MGKYDRVLFCTDFSEEADHAFEYACDMAQAHQSELHIFHATSDAPVRERLDKTYREKYLNAACYTGKCQGIKTECADSQGMDHEEIIKYAKKSDASVIVMGTHAGSSWFVGSCAKKVVANSPVPIFVVPPAKA
jgi:nucleotide-binding universal stress UspA family protein